MTKDSSTILEGELSTILGPKEQQQQRMFGALTQDSLKQAIAEYQKASQNQKEFETRFDIFKNKLLTVLKHNSRWEKGIAPFEMEIN